MSGPESMDSFEGAYAWAEQPPMWSYPYWYGSPVDVLPWWMRAHMVSPHHLYRVEVDWLRNLSKDANVAAGYPVNGPWYPLAVLHPDWIDPWSMQVYHGYWWP
ncbi:hypothetical protein [Alicyclobacillus herbarius]|uniref:hypothetical protein n=1 Tax=Alicyclobacillus herbarius TaxID=122960 RepID=UPI00047C546E|nr:hypothetical protein [Alicyclobacillus herbarius]